MNDRKIEPILKFEHFSPMTSAFFSPSGVNMVTTSYDHYLRIFNTKILTEEAISKLKLKLFSIKYYIVHKK